jgi:hypothetical protein
MLFHFSEEYFVLGIVFSKLFNGGLFQGFGRFDEVELVSIKLESWEDGSQGFLWELFCFDGFDEIGEIETFEFFHGLDEVFVLDFSEDSEGLGKFIDGLDDIGGGLSEFFPINVWILSDSLKDAIEVLLDGGNINLTHVEKIF